MLGASGADMMSFVVCAAAWLGIVVGRDELALRAAAWFIAAQAVLAYVVSGAFKAVAPAWRDGSALQRILATQSLGNKRLARLFGERAGLAQAMCWLVIVWECMFPLVLLLPAQLKLPAFAAGLLFHLSIAFTMGLNQFVWAFAATYPALWWVSQ
jgi:hypothetical protein